MHVPYDPDTAVDWALVFYEQALQSGAGGFRGYQYQRGASGLGGLLSRLLSLVLPIAKEATRSIGTEALVTSGRILDDLSSGRRLGDSLREHGPRAYHSLVDKAVNRLNRTQSGGARRATQEKKKKQAAAKKRVTPKQQKKKSTPSKRQVVADIFSPWES
jgi:hypothetical protein